MLYSHHHCDHATVLQRIAEDAEPLWRLRSEENGCIHNMKGSGELSIHISRQHNRLPDTHYLADEN